MSATYPSAAQSDSPPASPAERIASLREQIVRTLDDMERIAKGGALAGQLAELRPMLARMQELLAARSAGDAEAASLSTFLQGSYEREKAALARELHDQLGGILTPAKMDLAWLQTRLGADPEFAERMDRLNRLIDQGIDLKRRIIENLRPSLLDHLGLASALQWYVDETCTQANIVAHLHISKTLERLPPDLEIALYRLVQEAVTNAVKHARAPHLDLTIERAAEGVHMTVSDDGIGIADLEAAKKLSHGLAGMSHRARSIHGTFKIHSIEGKGTRVEMFVPLPAPAAQVA